LKPHLPVLYQESLEQLNIQENGIYLDCTFGRGGHSQGILTRLTENGRLLAIDRDLDAIHSTAANQLSQDQRFKLYHGCFADLKTIVNQCHYHGQINGILMDLGVSSPQLDDAGRGFSFLRTGPLDMRMDTSKGISAAQWLAEVSEQTLVKVLFEYGEERFARRIAQAIVLRREQAPFESTRDLATLIETTLPRREKHKHPATRTFQAIRIAINNELGELAAGLKQAVDVLCPGGRLVVIAFHSLEDRMVKRFIRAESGQKFNPGKLPIKEVDIERGVLKKVTKAIKASKTELQNNPRARSAIMRVAEKLG